MKETAAIILAAGQGSRMRSELNKVLHKLAGLEMINHVVRSVRLAAFERTLVVIGYQASKVAAVLDNVELVEQADQLGTGHAVNQCAEALKDFRGSVLVTYGDTPLFRSETFRSLMEHHQKSGAAATILTANFADPTGYGRILRDEKGSVLGVVEHKDADADQLRIQEINTGTYCFDSQLLFQFLSKITPDNIQAEYYLPDVLPLMLAEGYQIEGFCLEDPAESMGINDRKQLSQAEAVLRDRLCNYWQDQGVTIIDPNSTWIEEDCTIGQDTIIYPQTMIQRKTIIGPNCSIGPNCRLAGAVIGEGASVESAIIEEAEVEKGSKVVPFTVLSK